MIFDKYLFNNLNILGKELLESAGLKEYPQNIKEMTLFLERFKEGLDEGKFSSTMLGNILYNFVTEEKVRLRRVTSTIFEEIFSKLFNTIPTDDNNRTTPTIPQNIIEFDSYNSSSDDWSISTDLATNKREKVDVHIGDYEISLKTLKGKLYDDTFTLIDNDTNNEVNVGSFSIRALFKGLFLDDYLNQLSDRRGGLGSGAQINKNIITVLINNLKLEAFIERLEVFLKYVYTEDIYLVIKSGFVIEFILISNETFIRTLVTLATNEIEEFTSVFYRWENNNLRLNWPKLLTFAEKYNYEFTKIHIPLKNIKNHKISKLTSDINQIIIDEFKKNIES